MTKIERAKFLKEQYENIKIEVQQCLGNQQLKDGIFVTNPNINKHGFQISNSNYCAAKPFFLNAYYGFLGDKDVSAFNNSFYIECMIKAINQNMSKIREDTEKIMEQECKEALLEAKAEAEEILKMAKELN